MKFNPAWLLFLVGSIPLVAAYYPLDDALAPWALVVCCVAYLISEWLANRLRAGRSAERAPKA